jgi:hypothetical protein
MPRSMRYHLPFAAILACAAIACEERSSPVAPIATVLAARNAGAPQPIDTTSFIDPGLSEICGFPLQLTFGGKSKELVLPGDRIRVIFPGATSTFTNLTTGRTEQLVATGAVQQTTLPNGNREDVLTGPNLVAFDNSAGQTFPNSFLFITGRFSIVIDPLTGSIVVPFHGNGRIIDVCDLLS